MNKLMIILLMMMCTSVWAQERFMSLYGVRKGKKIGDLVTVIVIENATANNKAQTETDKAHDMQLGSNRGTGVLDIVPGLGINGRSDFKFDGRGRTSREGSLKATVSARIIEVYDNGNILIEGMKEVTINEDKEILEVSGVVRPEDIGADNTILSYNISDAIIKYRGAGPGGDAQSMSIFARILNWIF